MRCEVVEELDRDHEWMYFDIFALIDSGMQS